MKARTGAERYFDQRMKDPAYAAAYRRARTQVDAIDELIRALDERRVAMDLSKAELARRAGLRPEAVRRLLSAGAHNPTLSTVAALATALDVHLVLNGESVTQARGATSRTHRQTA
jgi:DNA-binding phage protein